MLISWGPDVTLHPSWRHDGSALDTLYSLDMSAELMGRTFVGALYTGLVEYNSARTGVFWSSSLSRIVNHIWRARLSWQPTQRITLRSIMQYNSIVADPELTTLETEKNLNVDLLATYLVDPWTAVYVGYNNNQNSIRLVTEGRTSELVPGQRLGPDSWQFFIKISYLLRF